MGKFADLTGKNLEDFVLLDLQNGINTIELDGYANAIVAIE